MIVDCRAAKRISSRSLFVIVSLVYPNPWSLLPCSLKFGYSTGFDITPSDDGYQIKYLTAYSDCINGLDIRLFHPLGGKETWWIKYPPLGNKKGEKNFEYF